MKRIRVIFLLLSMALPAHAQPVAKTMKRLPDTGQVNSYTTTFGEDSDYSLYPPVFLLNGDGTVTDTVTGLQWQRTDGGEMTIERAELYCDTLTLAGYTDWRLPGAHESFSILNFQKANPALDGAVFTPTGAEYWWTRDRQANDNTKVWCTNAGGGIGNHPKTETISAGAPNSTKKFHVRAVRDRVQPPSVPSRFADNGDGTLTDLLTGLMWLKSPSDVTQSWEDALISCENLTFASYSDWRLPNIRELRSLNDESRINPSADPLFGIAGAQRYWSSTSLPNQNTRAWFWQTQFGISTYDFKTSLCRVIPVRGPVFVPTSVAGRQLSSVFPLAWPNPFQRFIRLTPGAKGEFFTLTDVAGKICYSGNALENQDFSDLPGGVYILKTASGQVLRLLHSAP